MSARQALIDLFRVTEEVAGRASIRGVMAYGRSLGLKFSNADAHAWLEEFSKRKPHPRARLGNSNALKNRSASETPQNADGLQAESPGSQNVLNGEVGSAGETPQNADGSQEKRPRARTAKVLQVTITGPEGLTTFVPTAGVEKKNAGSDQVPGSTTPGSGHQLGEPKLFGDSPECAKTESEVKPKRRPVTEPWGFAELVLDGAIERGLVANCDADRRSKLIGADVATAKRLLDSNPVEDCLARSTRYLDAIASGELTHKQPTVRGLESAWGFACVRPIPLRAVAPGARPKRWWHPTTGEFRDIVGGVPSEHGLGFGWTDVEPNHITEARAIAEARAEHLLRQRQRLEAAS